jgi:hypothetical protein
VDRLAELEPAEILAFQRCFDRAGSAADRWELCAAASVIWGYISDDGFSDFRAGLIGLGRETFERVVADADALADLDVVRRAARGGDRFVLAAEELGYAAERAYARRTGDDEAFWEDLPDDGEDHERGWSGRFGSTEDAARIPGRLPRLTALFAEK